jgi:hypothetical protein
MKQTHYTATHKAFLMAVVASVGIGAATRAHAQDISRLTHPTVDAPADKNTKLPLPPAVPGSKPGAAAAAPVPRQALDMPPNDALFDAINRGDIASAKDAISRGADLTAQNVLGLTPLDLSVDLGRNDISFLLLSLRAADTPPPPETAAAQPAAPSPRAAKPPVAPPPPREVAKSAVKTPQLYAGDGGAAVPQAGFLGFGSARPAP